MVALGRVGDPERPVLTRRPGLRRRHAHGGVLVETERFARLRDVYGRALDKVLAARPAVYSVWLVLALLSVPVLVVSGSMLALRELPSLAALWLSAYGLALSVKLLLFGAMFRCVRPTLNAGMTSLACC
jgi:hypothetical protein